MRSGLDPEVAAPDVLRRASSDVELARRQLDLLGVAAMYPARVHLELAAARLHTVVSDDEAPQELRRTAERCRATLCSHVLAAEDLETAGVPRTAIVQLLRRAARAFEVTANGASSAGP